MKLPDINVLVYSTQTTSPHYARAVEWMETAFNTGETVGLAPIAVLGFIRIVTHPRIPGHTEPGSALDHVEHWFAQPNARSVHPGPRHWSHLRNLLARTGTAGNLSTDAHLAALAIEHNATVGSFDADFHRFPDLRFEYLNDPDRP